MAGVVRSVEYRAFLKRLGEARNGMSMSQAQLASILNKPPSFVGKYEVGERRLDVIETFAILRALELDEVGFLGDLAGEFQGAIDL